MLKTLIEKNRWYILLGAVLIQLALGSLYSWGALTLVVSPYIKQKTAITVYIFGISIICFGFIPLMSSAFVKKLEPKKIVLLGMVFLGIGTFLSAIMTNLYGLIITYGVLYGIGIGLAYIIPIAIANAWFPDKKGLVTGIAVAGFGAGSFIFVQIIRIMASIGPPILFITLGIIYVSLIAVGSLFMHNPPEGYKPAGWEPPAQSKTSLISVKEYERIEIVKTPQFWLLWLSYALSAMCGLMIIGTYGAFAQSNPSYVINDFNLVIMTGSIIAFFNAGGRIVWGKLADKINFKNTLLTMMIFQAILLFIYFTTSSNVFYYILITGLLLFCFGGNLALFPTGTSDLFGRKNMGKNYAVLFTAYGIAGFIGAVSVSQFILVFGGYLTLYIFLGILSIIAAILAFAVGIFVKKSQQK